MAKHGGAGCSPQAGVRLRVFDYSPAPASHGEGCFARQEAIFPCLYVSAMSLSRRSNSAQLAHLIRAQYPPFALGEAFERQRAELGAVQRLHMVAHGGEHAAHLVVAAFG